MLNRHDDHPIHQTPEPLAPPVSSTLGCGHPEWGQGRGKGELAIGGESFDPLAVDVLAPGNLHVQRVVRSTDGERTGIGTLDQVVVGPDAPAGFTDALDGAR